VLRMAREDPRWVISGSSESSPGSITVIGDD
jgi:hypothetical protein